MFARFDENPAMTLRIKRYGRTDGRTHGRTDGCTDGRTDGQRENSIPPTNKVCGGYNKMLSRLEFTNVCQNSKQGRPSSYCFFRSSLIWVCSVCLGLSDLQLVFKILEHLPK